LKAITACFWCVAAGFIIASILQAIFTACSEQELLTASAIVIRAQWFDRAARRLVTSDGVVASSACAGTFVVEEVSRITKCGFVSAVGRAQLWCVAASFIIASILQAIVTACTELHSTASAIVITVIGVIFAFDNGVATRIVIANAIDAGAIDVGGIALRCQESRRASVVRTLNDIVATCIIIATTFETIVTHIC
jgi:hypothetical protein